MIVRAVLAMAIATALVGLPGCGKDPCLQLPPPSEAEINIVLSGAEVERTLQGGHECDLVQTNTGGWAWEVEHD